MRRFLFGLLFLPLSSCDVLWGGFAHLNADVCENGGTTYMPGFACNAATLRCERLPSPMLGAVSSVLASNLGGSPIDILGHHVQAIQVGDPNGDRMLDLAIVNLSDNNASVSRNLAQ